MKKLILLNLLTAVFVCSAQDCNVDLVTDDYTEIFHHYDDDNSAAYIPAGAWYWDPEESGVGMSVSVQKSKHVNGAYFVFAAFYTYKDDGSQAWYTINGIYEPNQNINDWREDLELFGTSQTDPLNPSVNTQKVGFYDCYWGNSDTWMGEVDSVLYETTGGPVLDGEYSPNDIFVYKPIKLVWLSPNDIEIYIDGETSPSHTFQRMNLHGDIALGDADYLKDNYYHLEMTSYGILPPFITENRGFYASLLEGNVTFNSLNPQNDFADAEQWAIDRFLNLTEFNNTKKYYITNKPFERTVLQSFEDLDFQEQLREPLQVKYYGYIVITYDTSTQMMEGYLVQTFDSANDPSISKGLFNAGSYKFKGYLPAPDQGMISLYPAACYQCQSDYDLRPEVVGRSSLVLYNLPDLGEAFSKLPLVYTGGFNVQAEE